MFMIENMVSFVTERVHHVTFRFQRTVTLSTLPINEIDSDNLISCFAYLVALMNKTNSDKRSGNPLIITLMFEKKWYLMLSWVFTFL